MLNLRERQRHQVRDIREEVQANHHRRAKRERQRNVAARLLDLAGRERDVVPRVG